MTKFLLLFYLFSIPVFSQWVPKNNGLPSAWYGGSAIDASDNSTAVCLLSGHLFGTTDAGLNWLELNFPSADYGDISITDINHIWVATFDGKIIRTTNSGNNWAIQFSDTNLTEFMNYIEMFDENNGIAMGDALSPELPIVILSTTNGGDNWISRNDSAFGGFSGDLWRRIDFINMETGYFFESGVNPQRLYKTTNTGLTWIQTGYPTYIEVLRFFDENTGILKSREGSGSAWNGLISRTLDGGNSFETFDGPDDLWGSDFEFLPGDASRIWYVNYEGLFFSSDTGRTWTEQQMPTDSLNGINLVFTDNDHGWLLTNKNIYYTENGGNVTSVKDVSVVSDYFISQNYPNPFNPSTEIRYSIPKRSFVELKVYNLLGKEVAVLVNQEKDTGSYTVKFNAENLSSGVYFYKITAGNFVKTNKMVLIR